MDKRICKRNRLKTNSSERKGVGKCLFCTRNGGRGHESEKLSYNILICQNI